MGGAKAEGLGGVPSTSDSHGCLCTQAEVLEECIALHLQLVSSSNVSLTPLLSAPPSACMYLFSSQPDTSKRDPCLCELSPDAGAVCPVWPKTDDKQRLNLVSEARSAGGQPALSTSCQERPA